VVHPVDFVYLESLAEFRGYIRGNKGMGRKMDVTCSPAASDPLSKRAGPVSHRVGP
jgi:hypothetical protein